MYVESCAVKNHSKLANWMMNWKSAGKRPYYGWTMSDSPPIPGAPTAWGITNYFITM